MFTASRDKQARLLLYNTSATADLNIHSLVDIAERNSLLNPIEVRQKTMKLKKRTTYKPGSKQYALQVLEFPHTYVAVSNTIDIEPIAGIDW